MRKLVKRPSGVSDLREALRIINRSQECLIQTVVSQRRFVSFESEPIRCAAFNTCRRARFIRKIDVDRESFFIYQICTKCVTVFNIQANSNSNGCSKYKSNYANYSYPSFLQDLDSFLATDKYFAQLHGGTFAPQHR